MQWKFNLIELKISSKNCLTRNPLKLVKSVCNINISVTIFEENMKSARKRVEHADNQLKWTFKLFIATKPLREKKTHILREKAIAGDKPSVQFFRLTTTFFLQLLACLLHKNSTPFAIIILTGTLNWDEVKVKFKKGFLSSFKDRTR